MASFSVVVPCCNEESNISLLHDRLSRELIHFGDYEILYIDDGSSDDTLSLIKRIAGHDPNTRYLSLSRNFGLEAAFRAGFKYARYEWIIQIDADLQSSPEDIARLIDKAREGYDIVFAKRRDRKDKPLKIWGSKLQHYLAARCFGIAFPPGASTFRIIRSSLAKRVISRNRAYPYFIPECLSLSCRYALVDVGHFPRERGQSKFNLSRSLTATARLFLGHSTRPLHYFGWLTLVLLLLLPLLSTPAWLAAAAIGTTFGLWLHGLYLGRLLKDAEDNPLYLVREANIEVDSRDQFDCQTSKQQSPRSDDAAS